tara:strand:+ start:126 stop:974 length:849 start_codon:yes stop_codon:yes gene_type:complete
MKKEIKSQETLKKRKFYDFCFIIFILAVSIGFYWVYYIRFNSGIAWSFLLLGVITQAIIFFGMLYHQYKRKEMGWFIFTIFFSWIAFTIYYFAVMRKAFTNGEGIYNNLKGKDKSNLDTKKLKIIIILAIILLLIFMAIIYFVFVPLFVEGSKKADIAINISDNFYQNIQNGQYDSVLLLLHPDIKSEVGEEEFILVLENIDQLKGKIITYEVSTWSYISNSKGEKISIGYNVNRNDVSSTEIINIYKEFDYESYYIYQYLIMEDGQYQYAGLEEDYFDSSN